MLGAAYAVVSQQFFPSGSIRGDIVGGDYSSFGNPDEVIFCGPVCGGICPNGEVCASVSSDTCACMPASSAPSECGFIDGVCGGTCPMGQNCVSHFNPDTESCGCQGEDSCTPGNACADCLNEYDQCVCDAEMGGLPPINCESGWPSSSAGIDTDDASSSFSSSEVSCNHPDFNPPSCSNENNPPPFSTCGTGYHIEDQGCQEGTCGCSESTEGPKIRCQHTFVCKKDASSGFNSSAFVPH